MDKSPSAPLTTLGRMDTDEVAAWAKDPEIIEDHRSQCIDELVKRIQALEKAHT